MGQIPRLAPRMMERRAVHLTCLTFDFVTHTSDTDTPRENRKDESVSTLSPSL